MTATENNEQEIQRVLEALGAYQKKGRVSDDLSEIVDTMMAESDRGVVVILGSLLEDALLERLETKFVELSPKELKNLSRAGGLLANFDDRINLAHALGLIEEGVARELRVFKAMRNACAHSRLEINFLTKELRETLILFLEGEAAGIARDTDNALWLRIFFTAIYNVVLHRIKGFDQQAAFLMGQQLVDRVNEELQRELERHRASLDK